MVDKVLSIVPDPATSRDSAGVERLAPQEPLWRQVLGECLRTRRLGRGETLGDTATRAGLSPQYLSEIERGLKEPSSEMIAAVAGALDASLADLTLEVAETLAVRQCPATPADSGHLGGLLLAA